LPPGMTDSLYSTPIPSETRHHNWRRDMLNRCSCPSTIMKSSMVPGSGCRSFQDVRDTDDMEYKPRDDFAKSIEECYREIKRRMKEGGKPWNPSPPSTERTE
jgi:hypothetical protein